MKQKRMMVMSTLFIRVFLVKNITAVPILTVTSFQAMMQDLMIESVKVLVLLWMKRSF